MQFTDLGRDMKVVCNGNGAMRAGTEAGKLVVQCSGRTLAVVSASHFRFGGKARRYLIHIPEGMSGTVNGDFRRARRAGCRGAPGGRRGRARAVALGRERRRPRCGRGSPLSRTLRVEARF